MSEEQKVERLVREGQATEQRGLVADSVVAVVSGVSGGVATVAAQQALAKLSGDKGKDEKKD